MALFQQRESMLWWLSWIIAKFDLAVFVETFFKLICTSSDSLYVKKYLIDHMNVHFFF